MVCMKEFSTYDAVMGQHCASHQGATSADTSTMTDEGKRVKEPEPLTVPSRDSIVLPTGAAIPRELCQRYLKRRITLASKVELAG